MIFKPGDKIRYTGTTETFGVYTPKVGEELIVLHAGYNYVFCRAINKDVVDNMVVDAMNCTTTVHIFSTKIIKK